LRHSTPGVLGAAPVAGPLGLGEGETFLVFVSRLATRATSPAFFSCSSRAVNERALRERVLLVELVGD
jgi:hypothetical protein